MARVTNRQIGFLERLLDERDLMASPKFREANGHLSPRELADHLLILKSNLQDLSRHNASRWIESLLALPRKDEPAQLTTDGTAESISQVDTMDLPDRGYYAVDIDGTVKFYRVDRPRSGKWAGRTFVSVQASDELHPIRSHSTRTHILQAIAEQGPEEARARYGREIGRCGICNRTLTDETSRALGIGPICRGG